MSYVTYVTAGETKLSYPDPKYDLFLYLTEKSLTVSDSNNMDGADVVSALNLYSF